MTEGIFIEADADAHVRLRLDMLESDQVFLPPADAVPRMHAAAFPEVGGDAVLRMLRETGVSVIHFNEPLTNDRFIALGTMLGVAMPELAPSVQPFVEDQVILNLRSAHDRTENTSLQPFAVNPLTLHSESSGRPAEEQPRYIVLMCVEPGDDATAAQTVLIPMSAVRSRLMPVIAATLASTRYRESSRGPMLLRTEEARDVFSFRDFLSQPLEWTYDGDDGGVERVNDAIRALLASMYASESATGVHWTRGLLVVIDNTFFFHGRTAACTAVSGRQRHLKRLRISAAPSVQVSVDQALAGAARNTPTDAAA